MAISVANLLDAYGLMDAEIKTLRQQVKIAREALRKIVATDWPVSGVTLWMHMQDEARGALKLMDHLDAG